jgi:hypothetical protein
MKKINLFRQLLLFVIAVFSLTWCATFEGDIPVEGKIPEVMYISPKNQDGIQDSVYIPITFPPKEGLEITGYSLVVNDQTGSPVYTKTRNKEQNKNVILPKAIIWTGKNNNDAWVNDGTYFMQFEVWGTNKSKSSSPTLKVIVDNEPPVISAKMSPLPFTPDNNGENDLLYINLSISDSSDLKEWDAAISDPFGQPFLDLNKNRFKNDTYVWDGRSSSGELVQSAMDYALNISAEDMAGNKTSSHETIPIDILVLKDGDKYKIVISSIYFKAYTPDYMSVVPELVSKNLATLDRLAEILKKYSAYNIKLEGHAVRVFWNDPKKGEKEEKEKLLPLSKARAEAIKDALVQRGIEKERMTTLGLGSSQPVVPHSDEINRWKSRRVEFILIKK